MTWYDNAGPNRFTFPAVSYYYADTVKAVYWQFSESGGTV